MTPHEGLVHPKEYDIKDSNVELIGSEIDHQVKYNSAASEPAWNDGCIGVDPGLFVWRIEDFCVVPVDRNTYGQFFDGDSYITLHSHEAGNKDGVPQLAHDIFFWLGGKTSQDEAGVAAYKTVELDEFLHGAATQHRELQATPSDEFVSLFPNLTVRRGGVASGFRHVEDAPRKEVMTLLRVFKYAGPATGCDAVVVHEVEPSWESLDESDVFILDKGDKIWVWQGRNCSPMEKAKAAQVVHDMTMAKHVDVEVISQTEPRSWLVAQQLGGQDDAVSLQAPRPMASLVSRSSSARPHRLFRLSDASGELTFDLVKEGPVSRSDLDENDIFLLDKGREVWVWEGNRASRAEKATWLKIAQAYIRRLQANEVSDAYLIPIAKVQQGSEGSAFAKAIQVS